MSLHHHSVPPPPPQFATSTPISQASSPFGMVRLSTSPAEHFLMHHQARLSAAVAANMGMGFSSPSSSSSSEDKSLGSSAGETPMSRTNQYKKIMKPLLERKRRARINKCLDELKDIMTVALQAQGENVSKLEKADILELTVRHLHKLQQSQRLMPRNPLEEVQKFQAGYSSCAQEAATFLLQQAPGVDVRVSQRLLNHLSSSSALQAAAAAVSNPFLNRLSSASPQTSSSCESSMLSPSNNNIRQQQQQPMNGFHSPPSLSSCNRPSPPPRPSSNPETRGTFTVAITKAEDMEDTEEEDEDEEEDSDNSSGSRLPIKPSPIRLNPNDPVWRPF